MRYLYLILSFQDFFPFLPNCPNRYKFNTDIHNYYISQCYFSTNGNINDDGGVIHYKDAVVRAVIEESIFNNCSVVNSKNGGCIYFLCSLGGIVLNKVCARDCWGIATSSSYVSEGQFLYSQTSQNLPNSIFLSTVSFCSPIFTNCRRSSLFLNSGVQNLTSLNSSFNNVQYYSCLYNTAPSILNIDFATIANQVASHSEVIRFHSTGIRKIYFSNIVNTSSPNTAIFNSLTISTTVDSCFFFLMMEYYLPD